MGSSLWIYLPTLEGLFYGILTASYLSLPVRGIPILGRMAAWLGSVSYSIYLCHYIVTQAAFSAANSLGIRFGTPLQVVLFAYGGVLPAVVGFSALTYYVVELPFLRMRRPYLRGPSPEVVRPVADPGPQRGG
jgi:peptidoglycan/LPS O-acetylase OafA/YrhL